MRWLVVVVHTSFVIIVIFKNQFVHAKANTIFLNSLHLHWFLSMKQQYVELSLKLKIKNEKLNPGPEEFLPFSIFTDVELPDFLFKLGIIQAIRLRSIFNLNELQFFIYFT